MFNLFRYIGLRHFLLRPTRTLLTTLGVSFGIALFVGIDIINRSTLDSFRENVEAVAGKATLVLSAGESGFPESVYEDVRAVPGVKSAVPLVETRAYFAGREKSSETLMILGVDLLKEQSVRTYKTTDEQVIDDPLTFLNQADSVILTHAFAKKHDLKIDSKFELATARGMRPFTVRGLLSPEGAAKAYGGSMAIMDIDGARMTFGKDGKLDRIDIVTKREENIDAVAERIRARLGAGYVVEKPESQGENIQRMVKSYQMMLKFFSTLALLVGLFLVTNSVSIAVAERKKEIGTLRALGATRPSILILFLTEAAVMGAAGSFLGVWLGRVVASLMVDLVTKSLSLQFLTHIDVVKLQFSVSQITMAVALGTVAAFFAALWPASKAAFIQPLEAMRKREVGEETQEKGFFRFAPWIGFGLLSFLFASSVQSWSAKIPVLEGVNQASSMLGSALLGPFIAVLLVRGFRWVFFKVSTVFGLKSILPRLAIDNVLRNPVRTASNVTSLMVGLILVILIAVVAQSFRVSIVGWFSKVFLADLMVSSNGNVISFQTQPLHEDLGRELDALPGAKVESNGRAAFGIRYIKVNVDGEKLALKAYDDFGPSTHYQNLVMRDRTPEEVGYELFHSKEPVLFISENYAMRTGKKRGDLLVVNTPAGPVSFKIVGVNVDFASHVGVLYMDRAWYKKYWNDSLINGYALNSRPGVTPQQLKEQIDQKFGRSKNIMALLNTEVRAQMTQAVDQSFGAVRAVEFAALLVGLLGLMNTLLISVMERLRELGMLRAVGMSRFQLFRMILFESILQGAAGAMVAVLLGSFVGALWIKYSQARVLGWVIDFHFPLDAIVRTAAVGVFVAWLAGLWPSKRAAYLEIREALEYE